MVGSAVLATVLYLAAAAVPLPESPSDAQVRSHIAKIREPFLQLDRTKVATIVRELDACKEYPTWAKVAVMNSRAPGREPDETREQAEAWCASTCSGATSLRLPKELPDISKAGFIDVDSWTADNISAADFYRRYLRTGLPVVFRGAMDKDETFNAWKHELLDAYRKESGGEPTSSIAMCDSCKPIAGLNGDYMPKFMRFGEPFASADEIAKNFGEAIIVTVGAHGALFGNFGETLHFDDSCDGSFSLQFFGKKRWYLAAPYRVALSNGTVVEPLQRFEVELDEGDMLYFGPAWYHSTKVTGNGPSIAAGFYFDDPPQNAAITTDAWPSCSPFGFEACATAKHSMTERTAAWDFFIDGQGKALSPSVLKSVQQEVDKELLHATDGEL